MTTPESHSNPTERLALLYQLSQTFNSSLDLDEVLNRVMDGVIAAVRAERGFVMLIQNPPAPTDSRRPAQFVFKAARGMDQTTIETPQFQISLGTAERVAREGQPILTSDAQADERFNLRQSVMMLGLRSILCVPLMVKDRVLGVIYVDNRLQAGIFTQADLELVSAIASSAAIAIENARLYQVAVEQGRMEREMQMARKVQAGLLPRDIPIVPGWEFAVLWEPAHQVGGDYFDFIPLSGGRLGLVVADVTDKGMPAALFMASTRSTMRASVFQAASPAEGITQANQLITEEEEDNLFVTLFYAQLDPALGRFVYVNSGHNPALYYSHEKDQVRELRATGMPLGIEAEAIYHQESLSLAEGDFIVLYTDGITDAVDTETQDYGLERLKETLLANRHSTASEMLGSLKGSIAQFTGAAAQFDDITVVIVKKL